MPTVRLLEKTRLPVALADHASGKIMEQRLWQLLDTVSSQQGLQDFGLRVGHTIEIEDLLDGLLPRLMAQVNLYGLLNVFCHAVNEESSEAQFWLAPSHNLGKCWICRGGVPGIHVDCLQPSILCKLVSLSLLHKMLCCK
ncbi:MAG: hypothetical protein ACC707_16000 [Thiohalomonadales bacterium]